MGVPALAGQNSPDLRKAVLRIDPAQVGTPSSLTPGALPPDPGGFPPFANSMAGEEVTRRLSSCRHSRTGGHRMSLLSCPWPHAKNAQGSGDGVPRSTSISGGTIPIQDRDRQGIPRNSRGIPAYRHRLLLAILSLASSVCLRYNPPHSDLRKRRRRNGRGPTKAGSMGRGGNGSGIHGSARVGEMAEATRR